MRRTGRTIGILSSGVVAAATVALLLLPTSIGAPLAKLGPIHPARFSFTLLHGNVTWCPTNVTGPDTGYVCARVDVAHGLGFATATERLVAKDVNSSLSGTHSVWTSATFNLAAGYLQVREGCVNNSTSLSDVSVAIWLVVTDLTNGTTLLSSMSLVLTSTGVFCPSAPVPISTWSSPMFKGVHNSTLNATSKLTFVSGHRYLFTASVGCQISTQVFYSNKSNQGASIAVCNDAKSAASNTMTIDSIDVL